MTWRAKERGKHYYIYRDSLYKQLDSALRDFQLICFSGLFISLYFVSLLFKKKIRFSRSQSISTIFSRRFSSVPAAENVKDSVIDLTLNSVVKVFCLSSTSSVLQPWQKRLPTKKVALVIVRHMSHSGINCSSTPIRKKNSLILLSETARNQKIDKSLIKSENY